MKIKFVRFIFLAGLLAFIILFAGCQPISENVESGSAGGGESLGDGYSGDGFPSLNEYEKQVVGKYSSESGKSLELSANKRGNISSGANHSARSASVPTGEFSWSAAGNNNSTIQLTIVMDEGGENFTGVFNPNKYSIEIDGEKFRLYGAPDELPENVVPPESDNSPQFSVKKLENRNIVSRLVIVVAPAFENSASLKTYINHKKTQGFEVDVINCTNGETEGQIRNDLINKYNADRGKPMAVLIVGNYTKGVSTASGSNIPARYVTNTTTNQYIYSHPTDFYFGEYDDNWDKQEAFVGRFIVSTESELKAQTEKTMRMENGIFGSSSGSNMTNVIRLSCMWGGPSQKLESFFNEIKNRKGLNFYSQFLGEHKNSVINEINNGIGFLVYTGAASANSWKYSIYTNDVSNLRNTIYPVIVSATKYTGSYTENSLGKSFMNNANGGAVAFIGTSEISYQDFDSPLASGNYKETDKPDGSAKYYPGIVGSLYHDASKYNLNYKVYTTGGMLQTGHRAIRLLYSTSLTDLAKYEMEIYNLFGDPTYMPYTEIPKTIIFSCDNNAQIGRGFAVNTGAAFAQVALSRKDGDDVFVIASAMADATGKAVLEIPSDVSTGDATLYAIAPNYMGKTYNQSIRISNGIGADKSANASLKKIEIYDLDKKQIIKTVTVGNEIDYNEEVEYEQNHVKIYAETSDGRARVSGDGMFALEKGDNTITLTVTAENGTQKTYTLKIKRKETAKSKDYSIKIVKINGVPVTSSDGWTYNYNTNGESLVILDVEMKDEKAKCWIEGRNPNEEAENASRAINKLNYTISDLKNWAFGDNIFIKAMSEFGEIVTYVVRLNK